MTKINLCLAWVVRLSHTAFFWCVSLSCQNSRKHNGSKPQNKSSKISPCRSQMMFNNVLDRKETFFGHKTSISQSPRNRIFPKGLKKEEKQAFVDCKVVILKKSKNLHFRKGVNPRFWSKIWNFLQVCFTIK